MELSYRKSKSEEQTKKIAAELVNKFKNQLTKKCLIFALEGELGTGKTIFAKGVAEALGIKKIIRSPSFIIQREFPYTLGDLNGKFYHIDLWRMENEKEVAKLKIEDLTKSGNVVLIEWAEKMGILSEKFKKMLDVIFLYIKIFHEGENERRLEVTGY